MLGGLLRVADNPPVGRTQARFSFLILSNRLSISKTAICAFYAQVNSGETFSKVLATLPPLLA